VTTLSLIELSCLRGRLSRRNVIANVRPVDL
jgi:hypothetical protein